VQFPIDKDGKLNLLRLSFDDEHVYDGVTMGCVGHVPSPSASINESALTGEPMPTALSTQPALPAFRQQRAPAT
jgi:hypothetical protein